MGITAHGLVYPELTDGPNGPEQIKDAVLSVDTKLLDWGAAFPTSGLTDGQEFTIKGGASTWQMPSWTWRFKYDESEASAYKWRFIGGIPMFIQDGSQSASFPADTNFHDDPTLQLTIPLHGYYLIEAESTMVTTGSNNWGIGRAGVSSFQGNWTQTFTPGVNAAPSYRGAYNPADIVAVKFQKQVAANTLARGAYGWIKLTPIACYN